MRRDKPVRAAPCALEQDDQLQVLRADERASARDRVLVVLMLFTALRLSEAAALDLDYRPGQRAASWLRPGKRDLLREVPVNRLVRQILDQWLTERATIARAERCGIHT